MTSRKSRRRGAGIVRGMSRILGLLWCCVSVASAFAAEPQPPPSIQLKVNGVVQAPGARIPGRPGEKLSVVARVFGGRRAWCMEPQRYANMGKNTVIQSNGEDGLSFTTGPGFNGIWKLQSETATWWGQLTSDTRATANKNDAVITVPAKPGNYVLQVKATATWHYDRQSQGNHVEQVEKNDAEATYTLVVEQAEGTWFSSANIVASGSPDDDLRFRLQSLQQRFDSISQQLIDGQYPLAQSSLDGLKETLSAIKQRLEQLKKEKPGFACTITFLGAPSDKAMKRQKTLQKMAEQWKQAVVLVGGNVLELNKLLLNTQTVFTNNVLKSVFKNYIDWGSGIPSTNDLFGAVPVNLQALVIPSNVLDWYGNAQEDSGILKNQVQNIRRMSELRAFYQTRSSELLVESRKIHEEMDKAKPLAAIDAQGRALLSGTGWASWKPAQ